MHWPEALGLVVLGFAVGSYGTIVGLGGGFLLVPAFLFMHFDAKTAAGTSTAVILANGISGTVSYVRQRRVDVTTAIVFATAGIPGAWLGAYVDQRIDQRLFAALFAALLGFAGLRLLTTAPTAHREIEAEVVHDDEPRPGLRADPHPSRVSRDFVDAHGVRHVYRFDILTGVVISLFSGFVASALGVGGGLVQVPAMIYMFGFPAHVATATSHMIIAITALFGTASHALYGDVRWTEAGLVAVGAVAGAQVGARLARRVPEAPLLRMLAVGVVLTGAKLLFNAFRG